MEISWLFKKYARTTYKLHQWMYLWFIYLFRNILDIVSGIIGIVSLGVIQVYWSTDMSEKILKFQIKLYKEKKNVA